MKPFNNKDLQQIKRFKLKTIQNPKSLNVIIYLYFYRILAQNNWKRYQTARVLDIEVRTVRNYIKKLKSVGVDIPDSPLLYRRKKG
jgi:transcriptional regulator with GAF, ATPase, and Fis domain